MFHIVSTVKAIWLSGAGRRKGCGLLFGTLAEEACPPSCNGLRFWRALTRSTAVLPVVGLSQAALRQVSSHALQNVPRLDSGFGWVRLFAAGVVVSIAGILLCGYRTT
jgi:hypothetical protein